MYLVTHHVDYEGYSIEECGTYEEAKAEVEDIRKYSSSAGDIAIYHVIKKEVY